MLEAADRQRHLGQGALAHQANFLDDSQVTCKVTHKELKSLTAHPRSLRARQQHDDFDDSRCMRYRGVSPAPTREFNVNDFAVNLGMAIAELPHDLGVVVGILPCAAWLISHK